MSAPIKNPRTRQTLLSDMSAFCAQTGVSLTEIGRLALNDPSFHGRLRDGANITLGRIEQVYDWMTRWSGSGGAQSAGNKTEGEINAMLE